jgi:hypothetical protein
MLIGVGSGVGGFAAHTTPLIPSLESRLTGAG